MSEDLGITTGGDTLTHVLALGTNNGGAFTPDGIAAAVEKVAAQIRLVNGEVHDLVAAQEVDMSFITDWSALVVDWSDWKAEHSTWISDAWNSTRDELLTFRARYEELRTRWLAIFPDSKSVTFTVKDAPTSGNQLEDWGKQIGAALQHIALGAGVLAGVGLVAYLAWRFKP